MDSMTDTDSRPGSVGPFNIGLDPGFGGVKAAYTWREGAYVATVPSVVGVGETDMGLLSLGALGRRRRSRQPDQVTFDKITYLVGESVARYARPVERMDFLRLSDGPELRALFYDVVFRLLGEACPEQKRRGQHQGNGSARSFQDRLTINVMVGLPVEVMADREQARATLRALRGWMATRHKYALNGREVTLDVENVKVMAQPAGTFFAWGLNSQGTWVRGQSALRAPVAICDIGFHTLDLFTVEGGEVVARFTGGDTVGMRRAAELIISTVRTGHGVDLSLHEADALVREASAFAHGRRRGEASRPGGPGPGHDSGGGGDLCGEAVGQRPPVRPSAVHRRWGRGTEGHTAAPVSARGSVAQRGYRQCSGPSPVCHAGLWKVIST